MMHTKDEVHVWPNSHPRGGGGHIHSSSMEDHTNYKHTIMRAQNKNTTATLKIHEVVHNPARLVMYQPLKVDKGINLRMLGRSLPRHLPVVHGNSHRLSTPKDHLKMDKYKGSHMKSSIRSHTKKDPYNVHSSISHTTSLLSHKPVIKFGNCHKTSTPQDQLKMVEYEASHMESLTQFYMKNTYDVPSSARHPMNTAVMNTAVIDNNGMNHNSSSLNQVQKKGPQYKVKTSSDADATQDPDLARAEGLHPREGITRHSALPVGSEFTRVLASCSNPIAAGLLIIVTKVMEINVLYCFRIPH
jgi:hypothetical protein